MKKELCHGNSVYKAGFCLLIAFLTNVSPAYLYAQPIKDTLFINSPDGEYPLYKHLYIYKTDSDIAPEFVYRNLKAKDFIPLFPKKSYNELLTVTKHYSLMVTVKNNLSVEETLFYQLNSQKFDVVKGYQKNEDANFKYIGISGPDVPFNLKTYPYYDSVLPVLIGPGKKLQFYY